MKTKKALSDVSMFEAYKEDKFIAKGTRVVCVSDAPYSVSKGSYGIALEASTNPYIEWENQGFNKTELSDANTWAVHSQYLAPFPDELYNKLVLGVEECVTDGGVLELEKQLAAGWKANDALKDDVKVLVHLLRCSIEFGLTETDANLAQLLITKYSPRKKYTLEQLREKIGEDFDIVKDGEI
tara:strand:+ start:653 stop:1201 length:549 start_codon:yes stop_codon:yes gene_type:complete